MNPITLGPFLLACFTMGTAGASDVPPERMRAIYEEAKTPCKYGIVIPAPESKKVDCPTVFRHGDRWYMVYVQLENDPAGYTIRLAASDGLLHWQPCGTILARGDGNACPLAGRCPEPRKAPTQQRKAQSLTPSCWEAW